jgi:hypothetical protein
MSRVNIAGGCHCCAVRFSAEVEAAAEVLACNCSMCRHTGFLHLIVPHADITIEQGTEALTAYRFGTGVAEHLFCKTCGVKSFYQPRSHPDAWSINLNSLDEGHGLAATIRDFDGRNWDAARKDLG